MSIYSRQTQPEKQAEPILGNPSFFMVMRLRSAAAMSFIQIIFDMLVAASHSVAAFTVRLMSEPVVTRRDLS